MEDFGVAQRPFRISSGREHGTLETLAVVQDDRHTSQSLGRETLRQRFVFHEFDPVGDGEDRRVTQDWTVDVADLVGERAGRGGEQTTSECWTDENYSILSPDMARATTSRRAFIFWAAGQLVCTLEHLGVTRRTAPDYVVGVGDIAIVVQCWTSTS